MTNAEKKIEDIINWKPTKKKLNKKEFIKSARKVYKILKAEGKYDKCEKCGRR